MDKEENAIAKSRTSFSFSSNANPNPNVNVNPNENNNDSNENSELTTSPMFAINSPCTSSNLGSSSYKAQNTFLIADSSNGKNGSIGNPKNDKIENRNPAIFEPQFPDFLSLSSSSNQPDANVKNNLLLTLSASATASASVSALPSPSQSPSSSYNDPNKRPKILLMGSRRSGKSSILRVVFHNLSPNETLFLETTSCIVKETIESSSLFQFQMWDFPGELDFFLDQSVPVESLFGSCQTIVYVIDCQDDYLESCSRLSQIIDTAHRINGGINFEVFIHKIDGLSEDYKIEALRDIQQRLGDELYDSELEHVAIHYHLTSIYDHSIFEAFSKVIQKIIPELPTLENLLNVLCSNSGIEKAYLFDSQSKIYIATDSSPVDMQSYELCSDMMDVILDMTSIYHHNRNNSSQNEEYQDSCIIKMTDGLSLHYRKLTGFLILICFKHDNNNIQQQQNDNINCNLPLLDYNIQCFRTAILKVFKVIKQ